MDRRRAWLICWSLKTFWQVMAQGRSSCLNKIRGLDSISRVEVLLKDRTRVSKQRPIWCVHGSPNLRAWRKNIHEEKTRGWKWRRFQRCEFWMKQHQIKVIKYCNGLRLYEWPNPFSNITLGPLSSLWNWWLDTDLKTTSFTHWIKSVWRKLSKSKIEFRNYSFLWKWKPWITSSNSKRPIARLMISLMTKFVFRKTWFSTWLKSWVFAFDIRLNNSKHDDSW